MRAGAHRPSGQGDNCERSSVNKDRIFGIDRLHRTLCCNSVRRAFAAPFRNGGTHWSRTPSPHRLLRVARGTVLGHVGGYGRLACLERTRPLAMLLCHRGCCRDCRSRHAATLAVARRILRRCSWCGVCASEEAYVLHARSLTTTTTPCQMAHNQRREKK